MKKLQLDAIAFLAIILILGIANFINSNKPEVSELENRALKQKPKFTLSALASGSYFNDYNDYYNDTFIWRDKLLKISSGIKQTMFFNTSEAKIIVADKSKEYNASGGKKDNSAEKDNSGKKDSTGNETNPTNETRNTSEAPSPTPEKKYNESEGVGYWLVIDEYYAEVLNKYNERLNNKIPIYSLIAPTNSEFVQLKKYKGISDSQNNAIKFLDTKFSRGITSVNSYDILNSHKDEYIYFRSDHHWTALGAYYGYSAFMEAINEKVVPLENYQTVQIDNFLGSSYSKTMDKSIENNPDTIYAYIPYVNYKYEMHHWNKSSEANLIDMKYAETKRDKYLVFLSGGDATWAVIKTENKNGKKLLVMKDSYGNTFVPFLLPHYEEIYVVDPRFYDITIHGNLIDFIGSKGINEILFVNYMEDVNSRDFMESVENLMYDK
ncbi:MAG: hypothetical protein BWY74_00566 [Firmicutes bacterium ADurb.Bin419]|nr:MAG: hypothetical protein BWY74_00566 [Firmicutes bacterium ADurb.Bin419]